MRLSWPEIRARAAKFATDWKDAHYERGETQESELAPEGAEPHEAR
ncbi:MAG TPA: hypothetical protein VFA85_05695 [Terriglobales bacterium]|nr:hypothetical protein [Terriglobales bacterium]